MRYQLSGNPSRPVVAETPVTLVEFPLVLCSESPAKLSESFEVIFSFQSQRPYHRLCSAVLFSYLGNCEASR